MPGEGPSSAYGTSQILCLHTDDYSAPTKETYLVSMLMLSYF